MIKIIFLSKKKTRRIGKEIKRRLEEKYKYEVIRNTTWFGGGYIDISNNMISICIFNSYIPSGDIIKILKHVLKTENNYILCNGSVQYYIDSIKDNEKVLNAI